MKDMDGIMGRDFVIRYARGTWPMLPHLPATDWDDTFCRVTRDTDDLNLDRIAHDRNRGNYEPYQVMAEILEADRNVEEMSFEDLMGIVVAYHMLNMGAMIEHSLNRMLWDGNPAHNTKSGGYREFRGFELQLGRGIESDLSGIDDLLADRLDEDTEYILAGHPVLLVKWLGEDGDSYEVNGQLLKPIWDYDIPEACKQDNVILSMYAIPTSQDDDPLTYIEYIDYRDIPTDDFFWTDEGRYVWATHQEKWDAKLSVKNESRLIIKWPELVTRINVSFPKEDWLE